MRGDPDGKSPPRNHSSIPKPWELKEKSQIVNESENDSERGDPMEGMIELPGGGFDYLNNLSEEQRYSIVMNRH